MIEQHLIRLTFEKPHIFLSHSGHDADRAISLAQQLEHELAQVGHSVDVFNTSEPEHRYKDLKDLLTPGEELRARAEQYDRELREYLSQNLEKSAAFLALATPHSLHARSKVIEFEVEMARSVALKRDGAFFFPCVADGARLHELPPGARQFQGIELDKQGKTRLVDALCRTLSKAADTLH